jgi:glycosyltransferase involved in cell wall biosynthesis
LLDQITPLILTKDEEANIGRSLAQLAWAREVVLLDSGSTDATLQIARGFPNVRIVERPLDTLAGQTEFGLQQVRTPWVLVLDADYYVPAEMAAEMAALEPPPNVRAYHGAFDYAIDGRKLRASLYPARIVLLQREHATVWQDGHAPRLLVDGDVARLKSKIVHDDRKTFARFLDRQKKYMREEAEKIRHADPRALSRSGRVRRLVVVAPFAVLVHTLFVKGLILDGVPGLKYTWERFVAEVILSREMLRRRKAG